MSAARKLVLLGLLVITAILILMRKETVALVSKSLLVGISSVDTDARCLDEDEYLNRRYFSLRKDFIGYETSSKTDYGGKTGGEKVNERSRCGRARRLLREFQIEDVVRCFDSLSVKRNKRPMHIAFVGDSTIRQHFISFILWIPDYDRMIARDSTTAAVQKFHEDRNITTPLMDNLLVSFYWRNLIQNDLIADFKRWASTVDESPNFILLGVTAHHIVGNSITNSLETFETHFKQNFLPLINETLTRHPNQEIVWLLASPTMEYMGPGADNKNRDVTPDKIIKYNQAIRRIFNGTRVLIWDAMGVLTEEYLRTCALTRFQRTDKL